MIEQYFGQAQASFQIDNAFKKLLQNFKNYLMEFSTAWLIPSD